MQGQATGTLLARPFLILCERTEAKNASAMCELALKMRMEAMHGNYIFSTRHFVPGLRRHDQTGPGTDSRGGQGERRCGGQVRERRAWSSGAARVSCRRTGRGRLSRDTI